MTICKRLADGLAHEGLAAVGPGDGLHRCSRLFLRSGSAGLTQFAHEGENGFKDGRAVAALFNGQIPPCFIAAVAGGLGQDLHGFDRGHGRSMVTGHQMFLRQIGEMHGDIALQAKANGLQLRGEDGVGIIAGAFGQVRTVNDQGHREIGVGMD